MRPHAAPLCAFDSNIVGCRLGLVLAWQTYLPTAPRRTALAGWFGCLAWLFAFGLAWLGLVLAWLTRLPYRTTPHGCGWLVWLLGLAFRLWLGPAFWLWLGLAWLGFGSAIVSAVWTPAVAMQRKRCAP